MTDAATLEQSARYTVDAHPAGQCSVGAVPSLVVLGFVFGGRLAAYTGWSARSPRPSSRHGVLFFVGLGVLSSVLGLPLSI